MRSTGNSRLGSVLGIALILGLVLGGCGDDDTDDAASGDDSSVDASDGSSGDSDDDRATNPDEPDDYYPDGGPAGGSATLTIGDQTWEFDNVQCAIGSDETRSDDWDFSMIASRSGLQLNVDRAPPDGRYGDTIQLSGTDDPANPRVGWQAPALALGSGQAPERNFVEVNGKNVAAETMFFDDTSDSPAPEAVPGTLVATCP